MNHDEAHLGQGSSTNPGGKEAAPAPTGDLSIVFTDIKESTTLWEMSPEPMRQAIEVHDNIIRTTISVYGGYEVKVIGDAFMIAFPTAASALLWCLSVQDRLLDAQWPPEILENAYGKEIRDANGKIIFRGLSVRMGIHWGQPICKENEITKRADYIGPVVHRAARTIEVAEGGQIVVSEEFIAELRRAFTQLKGEGDKSKDACKETCKRFTLLLVLDS